MDYVFNIDKAELKTDYTIVFTGNCTRCDSDFKLEYSGADLFNVSNACIPEDWLAELKNALNDDYGYGPFKQATVNQQLSTHYRYEF
jgi:hypothetical protein